MRRKILALAAAVALGTAAMTTGAMAFGGGAHGGGGGSARPAWAAASISGGMSVGHSAMGGMAPATPLLAVVV